MTAASAWVRSLVLLLAAADLQAAEHRALTLEIRFEHHHFVERTVIVPAGRPLDIRVKNVSDERIEFESFKLHRETIVDPGTTAVVHLPALKPGSYDYFDDLHADVPEGTLVAK